MGASPDEIWLKKAAPAVSLALRMPRPDFGALARGRRGRARNEGPMPGRETVLGE